MELTSPKSFEPKSRIKELVELLESGFKQAAQVFDEDEKTITMNLPGVFPKSDIKKAIKMYKEVGWKEIAVNIDKENDVTEFTFTRNEEENG